MKIIMASWLKLLVSSLLNAKMPRLPVPVGGASLCGLLCVLLLALAPPALAGGWGDWWKDAERHARRMILEKEPHCQQVLCDVYRDGNMAVCYCAKGRQGPKWVCFQHGIQGQCF